MFAALRFPILAAVACLTQATPAAAQRVVPARFAETANYSAAGLPSALSSADTSRTSGESIALASMGGAIVGFLLGAAAGGASAAGCSGEWCGFGHMLTGGFIGQTLGSAAGAHVANRGRGDFGSVFLTAGVMTFVGWRFAGDAAAVAGFPETQILPIALALISQAAVVAVVERATETE